MAASAGATIDAKIPNGWTRCTVQDIVGLEKNSCVGGPFGSNLTSKDYVDSPGVPVSRGNNLTLGKERYIDRDFMFVSERKAATLLQNTAFPGDLVFTQRGTIGQIGLIPRKARFSAYILSQNQMKLRPNEAKADSVFLYYYFISPVAQGLIQQNSIGSTIPGFNLGQLRAFPLVLPPILEQRAIGDILGTLDDKIELNRRRNETLEAMARALFKSWFVDFDPVRAKAEGRDPGLPKLLADLFPNSFENSELGQIPTGWQADLVYRTAQVIYGAPFSSAKFNTDRIGKPLIRIRDLANENPRFFTDEKHPKGYLVSRATLLSAWTVSFAHTYGAALKAGLISEYVFSNQRRVSLRHLFCTVSKNYWPTWKQRRRQRR